MLGQHDIESRVLRLRLPFPDPLLRATAAPKRGAKILRGGVEKSKGLDEIRLPRSVGPDEDVQRSKFQGRGSRSEGKEAVQSDAVDALQLGDFLQSLGRRPPNSSRATPRCLERRPSGRHRGPARPRNPRATGQTGRRICPQTESRELPHLHHILRCPHLPAPHASIRRPHGSTAPRAAPDRSTARGTGGRDRRSGVPVGARHHSWAVHGFDVHVGGHCGRRPGRRPAFRCPTAVVDAPVQTVNADAKIIRINTIATRKSPRPPRRARAGECASAPATSASRPVT